jgi:hypothetical protein
MNANDGIDAMFKLIIECSIKIRLGNKIKIKEDTVYDKFQSNWGQIFPPRTCLKSYLAEIEPSQKERIILTLRHARKMLLVRWKMELMMPQLFMLQMQVLSLVDTAADVCKRSC